MFDLTGKTALVTGASGAIGGAIARALHGAGATIVASGTRADALAALVDALGARASFVTADLADGAQCDGLIERAEEKGAAIDILVNNAGLTRDTLAMRMTDDDWQQVIDVDLTAAFRLSRAALRPMMRRRWGRIISITSVVAVTGNAGQVNYAAAKAGLIGMSKALAREIASRGVTVNCVAPGFHDSPMTQVLNAEQRNRLLAVIPLGRIGTVEDVAAGVVYLASEEASYVTGQTLHINGGMAMI